MHVVFLYAALLALLFVALSIRTLLMRRRLQIAIGDAGNQGMLRAVRVHSNFAEYVPLSLLLLFFVEASGANPLFLHALGASILAGRISHAFGVSQIKEQYAFRVLGMALTLTPIIIAAVRLLLVSVGQRVA
jgi:uncharacterized membrane protein YecN with MAPEG domain